jgi:hypothetical protein
MFAMIWALAVGGCAASGGVGGGEPSAGSNLVVQWHRGEAATPATVEVLGIASADLEALSAPGMSAEEWAAVLAVYVESEGDEPTNPPAMVGDYQVTERGIQFVPRYPLTPGVQYRAVFHSGMRGKGDSVVARFMIPERRSEPTTVVENVYPTADLLPENQLKFYIQFSSPMSRGKAYDRIHLKDGSGQVVVLPFLEIDEELWDAAGRRLTVFFDPGRVKRELLPREQEGPALIAGQRYTLEIDSSWKDADGTQLRRGYRKVFRVGPADYSAPQPMGWRVDVPAAGSRDPLVVGFGEPLDWALLERLLWVVDSTGGESAGEASVGAGESSWQFVPKDEWIEGDYRLMVETTLEDLAGNSIGRLFELDVLQPIEREVKAKHIELPFTVSAGTSRD